MSENPFGNHLLSNFPDNIVGLLDLRENSVLKNGRKISKSKNFIGRFSVIF
jgi:hypothetical protein